MERLEELNKELSQLREELRQQVRTRAVWTDLREQVRQAREHKQALALALSKEEQDVKALEGLSLQALIQTILGRKEEQLEQERREALAARVHYQEAARMVEDLTARRDRAAQKLEQAKGDRRRYGVLLEKKKDLLKEHSPALAGRIVALEEEQAACQSMGQEIAEALAAGQSALDDLRKAQASLDDAEGWGMYDMLGGGIIATAVKHDHLDKAQGFAAAAQDSLSRFRTELADVQISVRLDLQIDEVATFCDYFFDGIFADWLVQDSIHDSQGCVSAAQEQVQGVLTQLEVMETQTTSALARLDKELTILVEKA